MKTLLLKFALRALKWLGEAVLGELLTRAARRIVDWLERHFGVSYATA